MNDNDVREWLQIADDDLYSARILNDAVRKPYEIICYHCAQAVEKYLKGYLTFCDIVPKKTHDLAFLNNMCVEKDIAFQDIKNVCDFLNRFANDIRYPHKYEINEHDVNFAINSADKVRNIKPIAAMRNL